MDLSPIDRRRLLIQSLLGLSIAGFACFGFAQDAAFGVRPRSQKGVYQPPTLLDTSKRLEVSEDVRSSAVNEGRQPASTADSRRLGTASSLDTGVNLGGQAPQPGRLVTTVPTVIQASRVSFSQDNANPAGSAGGTEASAGKQGNSVLEPGPVPMLRDGHGEVVYGDSYPLPGPVPNSVFGVPVEHGHHHAGTIDHAEVGSCDAIPMDYGCDSPGDWLLGPRILGGCCETPSCGGCGECSKGFIPIPNLHNGCWYSAVDWLSWERRGQEFPVLAINTTANPDVPLFGGQGTVGEDMDNGFRVSLGRWADPHRIHAIEARFWALEEQNIGFSADTTVPFAVGIPYLDANNNNANTIFPVISDPGFNGEFLRIGYDSRVMGGDIVVRQLWNRGLGGRIDMVYGYQFFRLEESLGLTYANQTAGPPQALGTFNDSFNITNNFHGAKLGFSMRYDEACWAFDGLFTLAFGGIQRTADLVGTTSIQTLPGPPPPPVSQQGALFVRPSNAGKMSDNSFAVSPEINVGLGYRLNHHMHFRVGYTYLMVTDVLQVYRAIDRSVDLVNPGATRPARNFSHDDYFVHGLNLGLTFNY